MKKIGLTKGLEAIVDDADFGVVNLYKWTACPARNGWRAYRHEYFYENGKRRAKMIYMHRLIMNAPKGVLVDHKDGNGLDNRRKNLRLCTESENRFNQRVKPGTFKGVHISAGRIRVRIQKGYKKIHVGYFKKISLAAKAYDEKAKELFGEFARTNF